MLYISVSLDANHPEGINAAVMDEAIGRAKEAAGGRDVLVHGVGTAAAALSAGVRDEVQLHLVPTVLGEGRRPFEGIGAEPREFELLRNIQGPGVTHLRYRVVR